MQFDDIGVIQFVEDRDLSIGALSIDIIVKGIENFFESMFLTGVPADHLPNMAISPSS